MKTGRLAVCAIAALTVLVGCGPRGEKPAETAPDPVRPEVIRFATGPTPLWSTADNRRELPVQPVVRVFDETVLVGEAISGPVRALDARTGELRWSLSPFSGLVAGGRVRSLPLVTTSATGGSLVVGFEVDCTAAAPCDGVPSGTTLGIAALDPATGKPRWQSDLQTATKTSGPAHRIVAADDSGVLVQLGPTAGARTADSLRGTTTVLLDAATGAELWRLDGFAATHLGSTLVLGVAADRTAPGTWNNAFVNAVARRSDGARVEPEGDAWSSGMQLQVVGTGGPGVVVGVVENPSPTGGLLVLGPDGGRVPSETDDLRWAMGTCAESAFLACTVHGRNQPDQLVTWFPGEDAPTSAELWDANLQLWAVSDEVLLMSENGYVTVNADDVRASWFAVDRTGTVLGDRRPGAVIGASDDYVVTKDFDPDGIGAPISLQVWRITALPD